MSSREDPPPQSTSDAQEAEPLPPPPTNPRPDTLRIVLGDLLETEQLELPLEAKSPAVHPVESSDPEMVLAMEALDDGFATEEQTGEYSFDDTRVKQAETGEESHVIGGRYRLREGLAMGGMGAVFKVSHLELGKDFALKIIHPGKASRASVRRSFLREAQTLSRLVHPNIVQITDFGADEKFGAYLVMEYLKGETLHARLKRDRRLPVGIALQIGLQVAEALHHMHDQELIHCDIKTENVFICRSDSPGAPVQAKLIDFGLSKARAQGLQLSKSEIAGTPAYIAPEQARGEAPQPSMDVYAVGMLLYEMITGVLPFLGPAHKVLLDKCSSPPPAPSQQMTTPLDPAAEALIQRALALEFLERQPSMAALVEELRGVLQRVDPVALRMAPSRELASPGTGTLLPSAFGARWSNCRVPMFLVDAQGRLELTSEAFDRLVRRPAAAVKGLTPGRTVLGNIYQHIDADVVGAIERATPVQRRIDFTDSDGKEASVLIWLVPETDPEGEVTGLWGTIVPVARG